MNCRFIPRIALAAATILTLVGSALASTITVDGNAGTCSGSGREEFKLVPGTTHTMQVYGAPCSSLTGIYVTIHNSGSGNITFFATPVSGHYQGTFTLPTAADGFCETGPVAICSDSHGAHGTFALGTAPCDTGQAAHVVASDNGIDTNLCGGTNPPQFVLSGTKWYDTNRDGLFEPGELPLGGFTIHLTWFDSNNVQHDDETTTLSDGTYTFTGLPQGATFTVSEVDPRPSTGNPNIAWIQSGPADGNNVGGGAIAANKRWTGTLTQDIVGLDFFNYEQAPIGGKKWFDHNANRSDDDGATDGIAGFKITIVVTYPGGGGTTDTKFTDANGNWTAGPYPLGSTYTVTETFPNGTWVQTFPAGGSYSGSDDGTNTGLNFGNYCKVGSGGLTLGFWSNKNGQAVLTGSQTGTTINAAYVTVLNGLNLRNANGSLHVFTNSYSAFKTWILGATATNMAYMLSAQLAASALDVAAGFMSGGAFDLCSGENISVLIGEASAALLANGYTVASGPDRTNQERLKNCLDALNNGALVIPANPCPVVYP
jgi:hypothetical protein